MATTRKLAPSAGSYADPSDATSFGIMIPERWGSEPPVRFSRHGSTLTREEIDTYADLVDTPEQRMSSWVFLRAFLRETAWLCAL
jgi:hypothetical protein